MFENLHGFQVQVLMVSTSQDSWRFDMNNCNSPCMNCQSPGMLPHRHGHGTACVSALEARCGYGGGCRLLLIVFLFFSQF